MKQIVTCWVALCLVVGVRADPGDENLRAEPGPIDVVFVGDSMTRSYTFAQNSTPEAPVTKFGPDHAVTQAQTAHGYAWAAAALAKDGVTSYSWDRHDAWEPKDPAGFSRVAVVNRLRPRLAVVMLGTNDALQAGHRDADQHQTPASRREQYGRAMTQLLDGFDPEIAVLLLRPLDVVAGDPGDDWLEDVDADAVNAMLADHVAPYLQAQAAAHANLYFYDLNAAFQKQPNWRDFYNDGVHVYKVHEGTYGFSLVLNEVLPVVDLTLGQLPAAAER